MSNLLRSDFYRLFKSKSFYICAAVSMILFSMNILLADWAIKVAGEKSGISELPWKDGLSYGLNAFNESNVQMLFAIIISIFVASEFAHGTMKNVVSKGFSKVQIYFTKLITMTVAALITIVLTLIAGTISATIVTGAVGTFGAVVLKTIGMEVLLNIALIAVFVMIAMVVKNLGGVIAINIIGIKLLDLIFNLLEYLVKGKIKFTDFSLFNNLSLYINGTVKGSDYIRSIIVGVVFFAAATALGILAFKKADVK